MLCENVKKLVFFGRSLPFVYMSDITTLNAESEALVYTQQVGDQSLELRQDKLSSQKIPHQISEVRINPVFPSVSVSGV